MLHPPAVSQPLVATAALSAQAAEMGGVGLVAGHLGNAVVGDTHDDAAANTAIGAHTANRGTAHGPASTWKNKKTPAATELLRAGVGQHGAFVVMGQSTLIADV